MSLKQEINLLLKEFANTMSEFLESLVTLGEGSKTKKSPEQLTNKLIDIDQKLQTSIKKLEEQQQFFKKIIELQTQIKQKDNEISSLALHLINVENILEHLLNETKPYVEAAEKAINHQISVEDIVEYAQRISMTTSAPPTDELSEETFRRYKFPFPTEVEMQQTLLYSEMGRIKPTSTTPTKEKKMDTSEIQQREVMPRIKLELNDTLQNSSPSLSHETQVKTEGTQETFLIDFDLELENAPSKS